MTKKPEQKTPLLNGAPPNKRGRPPGSVNKRTLIRDALRQHFPDGEAGFWQAVAQQAADGDMQATTMLADRLMPRLKPQGECVMLALDAQATPAQMARQIIAAVAQGHIAPDAGRELLAAVADVCKIVESSELEQRIQRLEEQRR